MSREKVILFGGSFNPPHLGHREVVRHLASLQDFEAVSIIPTYAHPFEKNLTSFLDRMAMCQLNFMGISPNVMLNPIEDNLQHTPSYFIDTLLALKKIHPKTDFTIALGSDCKETLHLWHKAKMLQKEASFYFFPRAGYEKSSFPQISSTELRDKIQRGESVKDYLHPPVLDYILEHALYK
ncbi:nicotinate-nicotinamide nucleotide adenylyltransferase [bacterium]|nr:nicotinate-nicotinamide nucleotide adenylyltransferase [bacterium]